MQTENRNGQDRKNTKKTFDLVGLSQSIGRQQHAETSPETVSSGWKKNKRKVASVAEELKRYKKTYDIKIMTLNQKESGQMAEDHIGYCGSVVSLDVLKAWDELQVGIVHENLTRDDGKQFKYFYEITSKPPFFQSS